MSAYILLRHRDIPDIHRLEVYLRHDGFAAYRKAVAAMTPRQVVDEVKASGLRGRGGAGFPTGLKWSYLPPEIFPRYVIANADESEPGTFKDRELLERNPFQFLEGLMIAAYATQANRAFVYLRGEFSDLARRLDDQIAQLARKGFLGEGIFGTAFNLKVSTHLGAGAYICGEESALMESVEGKRGQPRVKPPFPVQQGLYRQPTVINNVETLANVPAILDRGAAWYRQFGTETSPGVKIFSLSGSVNRPGNYELPLGTTFRELIETRGGGLRGGRRLKGLLPAGAASCILPGTDAVLDSAMDYESVSRLGSSLGSGSVIVFDDTVDGVWLALKTTRFFEEESCGKCTPCRTGLPLLRRTLEDIQNGEGGTESIALLERLGPVIQRSSFCALGQTAPSVVLSGLRLFRSDFESKAGMRP